MRDRQGGKDGGRDEERERGRGKGGREREGDRDIRSF